MQMFLGVCSLASTHLVEAWSFFRVVDSFSPKTSKVLNNTGNETKVKECRARAVVLRLSACPACRITWGSPALQENERGLIFPVPTSS